ncbi:MAG: septum formation inhibitor Maf [Oscillospiraceae bacterium]|nr:septum formation inhibitor Maf [Oscillospiraceae bacterium]
MKIILASQSPRRRELLERMGLEHFEIQPAVGEEHASPHLSPAQLVEELSRQKAQEVALTAAAEDIVIAADTVVAADNRVLGKPHNREDAMDMLRFLSGRTHTVYTGVTVRQGEQVLTQHEATDVIFRPLTDREIAAYVDTAEPMDKAGAYGIQGRGCVLVEGIRGDYYNVMGLPVCRLALMLRQFGVDPLVQE